MNLYFVAMRTLYVKATLYFPSCELLWLFFEQTQGFNLHVRPKQNTLAGLFLEEDLNLCVQQFRASYTEAERVFIDRSIEMGQSESSKNRRHRNSA